MSGACGMFADVACLTADTRVPLLDGRTLMIKEMLDEYVQGKELWVYSCDESGSPRPGRVLWAVEQEKQKEVLRIWLDNGKHIDASINHRFIKRDGSICRADELKVDDSLMPFHRNVYHGYEMIFDNFKKVWEATHQFVVKHTVGVDVKKENEGKDVSKDDTVLVIHHKDFNKLNNTPSNLPIMKVFEHIKYHGENAKSRFEDKEFSKNWSKQSTETNKNRWSNRTEEERKAFSKAGVDARIERGIVSYDTHDKESCLCAFCKRKRGIAHKEECKCYFCKSKRNAKIRRELKDQPSFNHKVTKIESLGAMTVYDITVDGSHLFALDCGIYIHNTTKSQLHEATVWVTTDSKEYQYQIDKLFDVINLEEVIYDWAWTIATFGDLFVKPDCQPGVGIVGVRDDEHPITISRIDYNGRLVGFYETPMGYNIADERKVLAPWDYVHFRLLGARKRRPIYTDPMYAEFRTISIMTPDARRLTSKYGTSILLDALPIYKRLKLAEDSVLMSRIGKGIMRYIYKVAVGGEGSNPDAVSSLIDEYVAELKRARAFDTSTSANYNDKFGPLSALEDIILPVWGDVNNLTVEKIGGEADIRWIKDIDELRNQLACALKVPLQILGGYQSELPSNLGASALERLDIRFARQSRRIQRALMNGITRLIQIHLAYQGIDPDLGLFKVQMAEGSSAEEEELKNALDKGVDVAVKLADLYEKMLGPEVDKRAVLDYINKKFLKLSDVEIDDFIRKGEAPFIVPDQKETLSPAAGPESPTGEVAGEEEVEGAATAPAGGAAPEGEEEMFRERAEYDSDIKSMIPLKEKRETWEAEWKDKKIKVTPIQETKSTG
jgi:hypothetical protein